MIHPHCKIGHNWSHWRHFTLDFDPMDAPQVWWRYSRACQNLGCDGVEYTDALVSNGRTEIVDQGAK